VRSPAARDSPQARSAAPAAAQPRVSRAPLADAQPEESDPEFYDPGSGVFTAEPRARAITETNGNITLNFEDTDLREVVKVILGDLLQENYLVDPRVKGSVTLQTSRPVSRDSLVPTLEMLLRMNGAALVREEGLYHVVPREAAFSGMSPPQLGDSQSPLPRGFHVRVVPLEHIAASEMQKMLEPFTRTGNVVRVDDDRNLLILAGSSGELARLLETVEIFDVDWLEGMSVALFTPDFVDAETLADELGKLFGEDAGNPLAGLVRFVTIERLNAVLALTPRQRYLQKVSDWVERLDRDTGRTGRRLFVYQVQNGKAVELAEVLNQVFAEEEGREAPPPPAQLAPGLEPVEIASREPQAQPAGAEAPQEGAQQQTQPASVPQAPQPARASRSTTSAEGVAVSEGAPIRIIPDEVNNALVIMATAEQYAQVEAALRKLDIVPLQVLIEATIAEITLTDELQFGLEWFFDHELGDNEGAATLDLNAPAGLASSVPGFSYAITDAAGMVEGVLNTLASDSRLNIISSPSLMVLNNQTANIQVGDEVPITTQQQQATVAESTLVNTIEFRDTGVLLSVTPRVNAGGLVIMEIEQEVSDVAPGTGDSLTPTIQSRQISSTVAVQSGETVVLGGLIRENQRQSQSGLPVLYKLPLVGPLFGQTTDERRRTELVVLITPRAVQGAAQARAITEEFRGKMESLRPLYEEGLPAAPWNPERGQRKPPRPEGFERDEPAPAGTPPGEPPS